MLLRPPGAMPGDEARERFWNLVAIMCIVSVALGGDGLVVLRAGARTPCAT